jgi:hypothetical protein
MSGGLLVARSRLRQRLRRGHEFKARQSFSEGGKPGDDINWLFDIVI